MERTRIQKRNQKEDVKVKEYLSFGAGVNSTALMLLLLDQDIEFEAVYVDPGTEWPETYDYLNYLKSLGYEFTWLKPWVEGENNLYDYLVKWKILPSVFVRCCTAKFKTGPFYEYIETPATVYIGYDFGESTRRHVKKIDQVAYKFPLIEKGITRERCKDIIKDHKLKVPRKSGCWFCPFQGLNGFMRLRNKYPTLYQMVMHLEETNPKGFTILKNKPLSGYWQDNKLLDYLEAAPE